MGTKEVYSHTALRQYKKKKKSLFFTVAKGFLEGNRD